MLLLAKAVVFLLAFVVPPVLVSVVGVKAVSPTRYEGPPAKAKVHSGIPLDPPRHDPNKPTAVVLLGNRGAEVTDVLAPYEVLSESGAFNVYAAAPEREAVTLSGGLDVLPQLSLAEFGQKLDGEDPDVIVVPEMSDIGSPGHRPVAEWLRDHAGGAGRWSPCATAPRSSPTRGCWMAGGPRPTGRTWPGGEALRRHRVGAGAALRRGRKRAHGGRGHPGIGATLHVIRGYIGEEAATALAQKIGYPDQRVGDEPRIQADRLTVSDRAL